jgi:hypothetical protein
MNTLETTLKVQGRTLKQIRREGKVALYELYGGQGLLIGYELILVRTLPEETIMGRRYPQREAFPKNEAWGTEGWSFGRNQAKEAHECFDKLAAKDTCTVLQTDLVHPGGRDSGPELC